MENSISLSDYIELNNEYLKLNAEIEEKVRNELTENKDNYPIGAEELYFFDSAEGLSPDDEDKLGTIEILLHQNLRDDYDKLYELREKIVGFVNNVTEPENIGENNSES